MSDFAQYGPITTLTRLGNRPLVELEDALVRHTRRNKAALLIPSLISELERPALLKICDEIAQAPYLDTVLISLDRADSVVRTLKERLGVMNVVHAVGMGSSEMFDAQNLDKNRVVEVWAVLP